MRSTMMNFLKRRLLSNKSISQLSNNESLLRVEALWASIAEGPSVSELPDSQKLSIYAH
jgi:hypothetical protein